MFVVAHGQKCDAAAEQDGNVEDDICFGHFLERRCVQAVQGSMEDGKGSHHPDGLTVCWYIAFEIARH